MQIITILFQIDILIILRTVFYQAIDKETIHKKFLIINLNSDLDKRNLLLILSHLPIDRLLPMTTVYLSSHRNCLELCDRAI